MQVAFDAEIGGNSSPASFNYHMVNTLGDADKSRGAAAGDAALVPPVPQRRAGLEGALEYCLYLMRASELPVL